MLTQFGKLCRKLRIDNNELLKDMADKLSVTPAYLSAVEVGKRNVPEEWPEKIAELYSLNSETYEALKHAADKSQLQIKINLRDYEEKDKDAVLAFARVFKELDEDEKIKIKSVLLKGRM
ncbi:MAG: helix-turn-helix transcriptional regulator [Peptococcaceae bacterium]|jgi:transcriptional regulator with XRE-family HTH domain|nr:helix-turn-helix domain-containing protein [Peptococcaceae bacterium]MDH7525743.1 helix-turn-helix transcriptional regulator [Peptococcaceae bacterium]